jgi:hypothetical protein
MKTKKQELILKEIEELRVSRGFIKKCGFSDCEKGIS